MRVIECLDFTIGLDKVKVRYLDTCRRKRHTAVYEQVDAISDKEADELIEFAKELRALPGLSETWQGYRVRMVPRCPFTR